MLYYLHYHDAASCHVSRALPSSITLTCWDIQIHILLISTCYSECSSMLSNSLPCLLCAAWASKSVEDVEVSRWILFTQCKWRLGLRLGARYSMIIWCHMIICSSMLFKSLSLWGHCVSFEMPTGWKHLNCRKAKPSLRWYRTCMKTWDKTWHDVWRNVWQSHRHV